MHFEYMPYQKDPILLKHIEKVTAAQPGGQEELILIWGNDLQSRMCKVCFCFGSEKHFLTIWMKNQSTKEHNRYIPYIGFNLHSKFYISTRIIMVYFATLKELILPALA